VSFIFKDFIAVLLEEENKYVSNNDQSFDVTKHWMTVG